MNKATSILTAILTALLTLCQASAAPKAKTRPASQTKPTATRPQAAPAIWQKRCSAEGTATAVKAARADAAAKLLAQIRKSPLADTTTVADLAKADTRIAAGLRGFCARAAETGTVSYRPGELLVDVKISLPRKTVAKTVIRLYQSYYRGKRIRPESLATLVESAPATFTALGSAAPPEKHLTVRSKAKPRDLSRPAWPKKMAAKGSAKVDPLNPNAAQAKLIALRAAEADARATLAKAVGKLKVTDAMTVTAFAAVDKRVRADFDRWVKTARVTESKINKAGSATATVEADTASAWAVVEFWQKRLNIVR